MTIEEENPSRKVPGEVVVAPPAVGEAPIARVRVVVPLAEGGKGPVPALALVGEAPARGVVPPGPGPDLVRGVEGRVADAAGLGRAVALLADVADRLRDVPPQVAVVMRQARSVVDTARKAPAVPGPRARAPGAMTAGAREEIVAEGQIGNPSEKVRVGPIHAMTDRAAVAVVMMTRSASFPQVRKVFHVT